MSMKPWLLGTVCSILATSAFLQPAHSDPLTFTNNGNFLDTFGVNPIGVGTQIGTSAYYTGNTFDSVFGWVTPSGPPSATGGSQPSSAGTTVTANMQGSSTLFAVPYNNSTAFPNQFFRNFTPGYTGAWTLIANNAGTSNTTATVNTAPLAVSTTSLPNTAVAISGSTLAPTISWAIPTGTTIPQGSVLKESVFLFAQASQGSGALYSSGELAPGTTHVTIGQIPQLSPGTVYSVSIQSDLFSSSGALEARTRQFTGYVAASATPIAAPTYLPDVSPGAGPSGQAVYQFNSPVSQGTPILLDPLVATGFIYATGASNPNFASVCCPTSVIRCRTKFLPTTGHHSFLIKTLQPTRFFRSVLEVSANSKCLV